MSRRSTVALVASVHRSAVAVCDLRRRPQGALLAVCLCAAFFVPLSLYKQAGGEPASSSWARIVYIAQPRGFNTLLPVPTPAMPPPTEMCGAVDYANLVTNLTIDKRPRERPQVATGGNATKAERIWPWDLRTGLGMLVNGVGPVVTRRDCRPTYRTAIIVPFRDRHSHLAVFLRHMHAILPKQMLSYAVFVIEQVGRSTFNRGKLMNVGYREANKVGPWDCYVFHDVDMLMENERNIYNCSPTHARHLTVAVDKWKYREANKLGPWDCYVFHDVDMLMENERNIYNCSPTHARHLTVAVDKWKYRQPYTGFFGGATAMTGEQMEKINGFSNAFWGWGGEDDEVKERVTLNGYNISRRTDLGRYSTIRHTRDKQNAVNPCRNKLLDKVATRWRQDGLSSLHYSVVRAAPDQSTASTRLANTTVTGSDQSSLSSTETDQSSHAGTGGLRLYYNITVDVLYEESKRQLDAEKVC